jgi:homoserine kinase
LLTQAGNLEGHSDNVAASIYGSITATNNHSVVRLRCPADLSIVVWIPDNKTSTNLSRNRLPSSVSFDAAVNAVGRSSVLVAAIANGDLDAMRVACQDDLHQPTRLANTPESAKAITAALEHGACAAWLSGSGPTVAAFVEREVAETVSAALPNSGHSKILAVAPYGISIS